MSSLTWLKMPFSYNGEKDFFPELEQWVGDLFYEKLPEMGYEIRDEQIYVTYHMIKALQEKRVLFAEAGSGTGKTFAYLLACLCYARLKGKPVILCSSSPMLQEQLTNPEGDIATLSRQLNLEIDARIARRQEHYACERKLERLDHAPDSSAKKQLLDWAERSVYGERSEIPQISDAAWASVAWDRSLHCDRCMERGSCRMVKSRRNFREARDFIICEHEVFFRDLWLREELQFQRRLTFLPEYSAVVFDEAHLIELPLAKSMGRQLSRTQLQTILDSITDVNEQRLVVAEKADAVAAAAKRFFTAVQNSVVVDEGAERMHVPQDDSLMDAADRLIERIDQLQDELVIEEDMHEGTAMELALVAYQEQLDLMIQGLKLLRLGEERAVTWWEPKDSAMWVIPREFSHALRDHLLVKHLPILFTSATLAVGDDFTYMQQMTGAQSALRARVGVPFDLAEQVVAYVANDLPAEDESWAGMVSRIEDLLAITHGRTLILCNSGREVRRLREAMKKETIPYRLLWEGDAHRAQLVDDFRNDLSSVLIGSEFWEGVDVPGEALSHVIIVSLPFPRHDPLVEARRREAKADGYDPYQVIDLPTMLIKLRQGFGRLIRTVSDRGMISVLDSRPGTDTHQLIFAAIPKGVATTSDLAEAAQWANKLLG